VTELLDVPLALVEVVASDDDDVDELDVLDDDVDVDAAVLSSLSPRLPGLAMARLTPTRTRTTAAANRSRDRNSRGITSSSD